MFEWLFGLRSIRGSLENDIAVPVVIRNVSCPYCGRVYPVMTLGALRSRVDPNPLVRDGSGALRPNPGFIASHIGNPIRCPACGREFYVFVGVEASGRSDNVRGVHVKIASEEEPLVKDLVRWPHRGLVDPKIIEYRPFQVLIYRNLEHFLEYNEGQLDIAATSLPSDGVPFRPEEGSVLANNGVVQERVSGRRYPPPRVVNVSNVRRYFNYIKNLL